MPEIDFEKLGVFYLGKNYDIKSKEVTENLTLLRSKDLTTHAVCLGMTGSGKTGLCISMLEEAALDNIPVIAIDPKGDISNMLLTFEEMTAEKFKPWVSESEARQKEISLGDLAQSQATLWSKGIRQWGQTEERIKKIHESVDMRIYTPGSSSGIEVSLYSNFSAPEVSKADLPEIIENTVTSYLALVDKKVSEPGSPEHSFLSEILSSYWSKGESLSFPDFIGAIMNPPFDKVGALNLESFFPKKERQGLALKFNAIYASPAFKTMSRGESLSIPKLLYGENGRAQVSILSISHLDENERIFFVSQLLNQLVSWVRKQTGTSSLRALLYMDEIYGYFPPLGNPPTKKPMLTLLKQARAQGLGVVLATQNPVDLDYKGLSNTGTWFIGRLQTEQDKERLLEGLKSIGGDSDIDWSEAISSLDKRVFLLRSVHMSEPVFFHTRWALSYLSGPINSSQIEKLMEPYKASEKLEEESPKVEKVFKPNLLPKEISQKVAQTDRDQKNASLAAISSVYYNFKKSGEEKEVTHVWTGSFDKSSYKLESFKEEELFDLENAKSDYAYQRPNSSAELEKTYTSFETELKDYIYRDFHESIWECEVLDLYSHLGEGEEAFRGRISHLLREKKDEEIDKITERYKSKIERIEDRILRAEQKVEKEKEQYSAKRNSVLLNLGTAVASIFLGGKKISVSNANKAGAVLRGATSASKEKGDISRAEKQLEEYLYDLQELKDKLEDEIMDIEDDFTQEAVGLKAHKVKPLKRDIKIKWKGLLWT